MVLAAAGDAFVVQEQVKSGPPPSGAFSQEGRAALSLFWPLTLKESNVTLALALLLQVDGAVWESVKPITSWHFFCLL